MGNLRILEGKGVLRPVQIGETKTGAPHWGYAAIDVEGAAKNYKVRRQGGRKKSYSGKLAARVFALIEQGKSLREIVIETEADPKIVRELWSEAQLDFKAGEQAKQAEKNRELLESEMIDSRIRQNQREMHARELDRVREQARAKEAALRSYVAKAAAATASAPTVKEAPPAPTRQRLEFSEADDWQTDEG